jgi:LPS export ABC transporter protein LptC
MKSFSSIIMLLIVMLLSGCKNEEDLNAIRTRSNPNIEIGKDVDIIFTEMGKMKIKAKSKTTYRHNTERPYMEFMDGIEIYFYDGQGNVESLLTAKYATSLENSRSMTARNNVEVINSKGEKLNTEELVWDEENGRIYSKTNVKVTTQDEIIYGKGFDANQNFTDYTVKSITGIVKVKDQGLD